MAEAQQTEDRFSIPSQIERCEQRIARQRQIVDDLLKFNAAGPAKRLLAIMEHTLAGLRQQEQELRALPVRQLEPNVSA
jgi:hypothetical protein